MSEFEAMPAGWVAMAETPRPLPPLAELLAAEQRWLEATATWFDGWLVRELNQVKTS